MTEGAVEVQHCMAELVDNDVGGITSEAGLPKASRPVRPGV